MDDREIWVRFAAAALPVAHDTWTPSLGYSPTAIAAGTADALLAEYRTRYAPERDEEVNHG